MLFADGQPNAAVPDVQPPPAALVSALETVLNMIDKEFPIAVNAPIAATETKAAIKAVFDRGRTRLALGESTDDLEHDCNLLLLGKPQSKFVPDHHSIVLRRSKYIHSE